jgi:hypothetical protein
MEKIWSAEHVRNELKLNIFAASVISVFCMAVKHYPGWETG